MFLSDFIHYLGRSAGLQDRVERKKTERLDSHNYNSML